MIHITYPTLISTRQIGREDKYRVVLNLELDLTGDELAALRRPRFFPDIAVALPDPPPRDEWAGVMAL